MRQHLAEYHAALTTTAVMAPLPGLASAPHVSAATTVAVPADPPAPSFAGSSRQNSDDTVVEIAVSLAVVAVAPAAAVVHADPPPVADVPGADAPTDRTDDSADARADQPP